MIKIFNKYTRELIRAIDEESLRAANLSEANLRGADLSCADLSNADLSGADLLDTDLRDVDLSDANLRGTNLRGADLRFADLRYADLRGADLRGADLSNANLSNANLSNADIRYANLRDTIGDRNIIITIHTPQYHINLTKDFMQIGCRRYTYKMWWNFTDEQIKEMDDEKALNFWRKYKEYLILSYKLAFEDKEEEVG